MGAMSRIRAGAPSSASPLAERFSATRALSLALAAPLSDAFAQWARARLPTEFEWDMAATGHDPAAGNQFDSAGPLGPVGGDIALFGDCWQWTRSAYLPYPRFRTAEGAVGEYNGSSCRASSCCAARCALPRGRARVCDAQRQDHPHREQPQVRSAQRDDAAAGGGLDPARLANRFVYAVLRMPGRGDRNPHCALVASGPQYRTFHSIRRWHAPARRRGRKSAPTRQKPYAVIFCTGI